MIPARGGSKRIPRKNIREFCGKPMLAWSIEAARQAGCFDRIVVSTDDEEIAEVSRFFGAEVPFMRPAELADDRAGTIPVMAHAVQWLQRQGVKGEAMCCLYATAPFVQAAELRQGRELLNAIDPDRFVFTATAYASPIQRALKLDPLTGEAHMWQPEHFHKRSQDLEAAYYDAGQFYWGRPQAWLTTSNLFEGGRPLLLPRWRVHDIDTEDDWRRAELIHAACSNS